MGLYLSILVILAVVGWFAVGTQFNIRKGHKAMAWLQGGLKLLGEKTTLRWLGSSAVELKITQARAPFRHAEVVLVLEPRDISVLWWYYHLRGRRDLLIVRGQLVHSPAVEFEAFDSRSWSNHGLEATVRFRNWNPLPLTTPDRIAYAVGNPGDLSPLLSKLAANGHLPVRLSVRRSEPNFEVQWYLDEAQRSEAHNLFTALCALAQQATAGRG